MHPRPCAHCGINFMKRNPNDDQDKICNSCLNKEKIKKNKEEVKMSKITIECTPEEYAKIEELCMNEGKNYSDYFLDLHRLNIQNGWEVKKVAMDDPNEEFAATIQNKKRKIK